MTIKLKMWYEAMKLPKSAHLVYPESEAVIYKGVKIEKTENDIKIYSTQSDFYSDMTEEFIQEDGFLLCVNIYLKKKYLDQLDRIEMWIQKEVNGQKNHKRITNLKKFRENLITKYNEVNP
jgi:hypothetical protein